MHPEPTLDILDDLTPKSTNWLCFLTNFFIFRKSFTSLTAKFNVRPASFPLFSPYERQTARATYFLRKIRFFLHF